MTDLEMIKKCAEQIGIKHRVIDDTYINYYDEGLIWWRGYSPLHDDAQAMALVKKFVILIGVDDGYWTAFIPSVGRSIHNKDLNRAIVECVAKM
jgi:hypothetical protein